MKPSTRISSLLTLVVAASAVAAPGASAQAVPAPLAPYVTEPIMTTQGPVIPSIGNGTIAWAVLDDPSIDSNVPGTNIWTLRDGKPAVAARLPTLRAERLEAGTDAAGNPVAIVSGLRQNNGAPTPFYLARLDTGLVRRLHLGAGARSVDDVAIDAGRVLSSTSVRRGSFRARSWLRSARLHGSALTHQRRLRRSRRGETFETVRADRNRIATTGYRKTHLADGTAYLPLYAGTAHGTWRKIGTGSEGGGGRFAVEAAGFSPDRRSVIVSTTGPGPGRGCQFEVRRVRLRSGRQHHCGPGIQGNVTLANPEPEGSYVEVAAAYDPATDRLLVSSAPDGGDAQLGWSSVLG